MIPSPSPRPTFYHSRSHLPHPHPGLLSASDALLTGKPFPAPLLIKTVHITFHFSTHFPRMTQESLPLLVKLVLHSGLSCPSLVLRGEYVYTSNTTLFDLYCCDLCLVSVSLAIFYFLLYLPFLWNKYSFQNISHLVCCVHQSTSTLYISWRYIA